MRLPLNIHARITSRSWWAVRYRSRDELDERQCDWLDLPRIGLVEVRLYCPNGQVAVLGNNEDLSHRAFQFKSAEIRIGGDRYRQRMTTAHTIGIVNGEEAATYTWDYNSRTLTGPIVERITSEGGLLSFGPVGQRINFAALGVK